MPTLEGIANSSADKTLTLKAFAKSTADKTAESVRQIQRG
jgi:hypothetical protein